MRSPISVTRRYIDFLFNRDVQSSEHSTGGDQLAEQVYDDQLKRPNTP